MRAVPLALAIGACCFHLVPAVLPPVTLLSVSLIAFVLLARFRAVSACMFGFVLTGIVAAWSVTDRWPESRHGEDVTVEGVVNSLPDRGGRGGRFLFLPDRSADPDLPRRVRVSWYVDEQVPAAGSRWRLTLRMRAPRGAMNPQAFDYERWLVARRIGATATVRSLPAPEQLSTAAPYGLTALRTRIDRVINDAMDEHPRRAMVRGLTLGERGEIDHHEWEVFARTGTAHLMAISGLHVGMVATMVFLIASGLASRVPGLQARSREAGVALGLVAAAVYAALAGFAVPTRRALCMLIAAAVQLCSRRMATTFTAWSWALAAVVMTDPLSPLTIGFWLSFGAVFFIAWVVSNRRDGGHAAIQLLRIQWAVAIGLLPLTLWFFQRGSVVAPLANLLAVPAFTVLVVPATLAGTLIATVFPTLAHPSMTMVGWVLDLAWMVLESISEWSWATRFTPRPPFWTVLAAGSGAAIALLPRGVPMRILVGASLMLPMLCWLPAAPPHAGWRLTLLEVGQGLAAVVRTANHVLVFDTGPSFGPATDAGARVVVPYLRAQGDRTINLIMVSHPHDDHDGGLQSVMLAYPGTPVLAGDPAALPVPGEACTAGRAWSWDGVAFRVLHPQPGDIGSPNLISCVLEVDGPGGRLLLTGDIEWPSELILSRPGSPLRPVDVIVVAHHGSRTSSIPRFVMRTRPAWALVPAGYGNRWGFPDEQVVARWQSLGARVLVVGDSGALTVEAVPGAGVAEPIQERSRQRRWWRTLLSSVERGNG